tara:strand:- start:68 stop:1150 length:1083 start_codon:yes stop_codon:yes gene_type:complete
MAGVLTPRFFWRRNEDTDVTDYASEQRAGGESPQEEGYPEQAQVQPHAVLASDAGVAWKEAGQGISWQDTTTGGAPSGGPDSARTGPSDRLPLERETQEEREERLEQQREEGDFSTKATAQVNMQTIDQAKEHCEALLNRQLERAEQQLPPMNTPIYGDAQTRRAMLMLLPDAALRDLFLQASRSRKAWPRLRSLFGAPPYVFLRPEDAGLVRASGIATGRTSMTYDSAASTANYSQFGTGHLIDDFLREYKILPRQAPDGRDPLPFDMSNTTESVLFMNVRVPKRRRADKIALLKDQSKRAAVLFPLVGEVIRTRYSPGLCSVWSGGSDDTRMKLRVTHVLPRGNRAAIAAVMATKLYT